MTFTYVLRFLELQFRQSFEEYASLQTPGAYSVLNVKATGLFTPTGLLKQWPRVGLW